MTTPIYGLRYQILANSPHGPNLGRHLAEDVEAQLDRMEKYVVEVTASALQNVGPAAEAITFSTVVTDLQNMFAIGTPSRLIAPIAGRYQVDGEWYTGAQSAGSCDTWLRLNGSGEIHKRRNASLTAANNFPNVSATVVLAALGYVELMGVCTGGAVDTTTPFARACMRYVGPV